MAKKKTLKKVSKKVLAVKTPKSKNFLQGKLSLLTEKLNSLNKSKYFLLTLIILILISLGYAGRSLFVAAMVGGRPISRLTLVKELEKRSGQEALEGLITKELIAQEARKRNVVISDTDIKAEIDRITGIVEAQGTTLEAALEMQGQSREDLEDNIKIQKTVEGILSDSLQVSDEEILKYFEENKEIYGADSKYEDLKASIKDQLSQEKLSGEFQTLLEKLRAESNIVYFVNYK